MPWYPLIPMGDLPAIVVRAIANAPDWVLESESLMAQEILRRRASHEAIRDKIRRMRAFIRVPDHHERYPAFTCALEDVVAAWYSAEYA